MKRLTGLVADEFGVALVAVATLLIAVSVPLLPVTHAQRDYAWTTAAIVLVISLMMWSLAIARINEWFVAAYPIAIFVSAALLGAHVAVAGSAYGSVFTLSFVFIGMRLPRGAGLYLMPVAGICWWTSIGGFKPGAQAGLLGVRLTIALAVWVLIAELLAARTAGVNTERSALVFAAQRDPLTSLHNRAALPEIFDHAQVGDAFILIDFDHFKDVNDTYGHAVGDQLLVEFAATLNGTLRRGDTAIRYGGEEILIYLRQPGAALPGVAMRLRYAHERTNPIATYSAGAAFIGLTETGAEAVARADQLLYQAKDAGRNRDVVESTESVPVNLREVARS